MATSYCIVVVANSASSLGYECCLKHTQLGLLLFRFKCQQRTRHMAHAAISKSKKKSKIYVLCFSVMKCFRYCRSFISCCCCGCYSFFLTKKKPSKKTTNLERHAYWWCPSTWPCGGEPVFAFTHSPSSPSATSGQKMKRCQ